MVKVITGNCIGRLFCQVKFGDVLLQLFGSFTDALNALSLIKQRFRKSRVKLFEIFVQLE